jgi:hypothetical protein
MQVALAEAFWPSSPDGSGLFAQILNALSVAIAVLAAIAGPELVLVAAVAEVLKGVISGVIQALNPEDQQLENLALLERYDDEFLTKMIVDFTVIMSNLWQFRTRFYHDYRKGIYECK